MRVNYGRFNPYASLTDKKQGFDMVHRRVRGGKYKIKHVKKVCPVELGQELEVTITEIGPSGDGMSTIQGYVIMVPKAKPRDTVKVKMVQVGEKTAIGHITE